MIQMVELSIWHYSGRSGHLLTYLPPRTAGEGRSDVSADDRPYRDAVKNTEDQ